MEHLLKNDDWEIRIHEMGAELQSIKNIKQSDEYLWQGDSRFWNRRAPVLFPFVGKLKDNKFNFMGESFPMGQHGFARDRHFKVINKNTNSICFELISDTDSLAIFPFEFSFIIRYSLIDNALETLYQVSNTANSSLYFSLGAHPAFHIPLNSGGELEQVAVAFNKRFSFERHLLEEGLFDGKSYVLPTSAENVLALQQAYFEEDAIVFKDIQADACQLMIGGKKRLEMDFPAFPYFGIWTKVGAPFLCLEPWCGIADSIHGNSDLSSKEGINHLEAGKSFKRKMTLRFY